MKSSHFGIFALVSLSILLTVPSAFADEPDQFSLMLQITDGQADLENLEALVADNSFTVDWGDYTTETFEYAAELVDMGEYAAAQAVLDDAEISHDIIYDQLYEQIEDQQVVRHEEYVINAKSSLTFLIENGSSLGLTQPVIDQLAITLAILESGTYDEIDAATGQIGITLSVLPSELSLPPSFTTGSGAAEQLKSKLPPGIAKKYGYSTDSDVGTQITNGDGNENNALSNGRAGDFFSNFDDFIGGVFPGFGASSGNADLDNNGKGVGLGEVPPGIANKFDISWIYYGFSPDDGFGSLFEDDFAPGHGKGREYGMKMKAEGQEKADAGQAQGEESSGGNGQGQGQGGPPCGSPPCNPPPGGGGGGPPGGP